MENDFIKKSLDEKTPKDIKIKIELSNKHYFKLYLLWICKGLTISLIYGILIIIGVNIIF